MSINYIPKHTNHPQFMIIEDIVMERHLVFSTRVLVLSENYVPTLSQYLLSKWSDTETGIWVDEHGYNQFYMSHRDIATDELLLSIYAYISPKRWTEYCLKFVDKNN